MANGHIEIHDPMSNCNGLSSATDCDHKSTSDTDSMEDTVEFRILMAYAERRRPTKGASSPAQHSLVAQSGDGLVTGPSSPQTPAKPEKEKKKEKKGKGKRLLRFLSCIRPQTNKDELHQPKTVANQPDVYERCLSFNDAGKAAAEEEEEEEEEEDELKEVASRLTEIADEIPFTPPEIEADSPEDVDVEVEKVIGLLLRDAGDRLNDRELIDAAVARELFWKYSFFKALVSALLRRMGLVSSEPDSLGPQASPKTQIAVTCEVTSRLSAVNMLPMSRMLDHGARYLQEYYSSWIQQQGGYEEAFHSDEEE